MAQIPPGPHPRDLVLAMEAFKEAPYAAYYPDLRKFVPVMNTYKVPERFEDEGGIPRYLLPEQQRFAQSQARERWYKAGNRGGKTFIGALEASWVARGKHPYRDIPKRDRLIWVGGPDHKHHKTLVIPLLLKILGKDGVKRKIADSQIIVKGIDGFTTTIDLKSYDSGPTKFQGANPDLTWMDEIPPYDIYEEISARIGAAEHFIIGTMTPASGVGGWWVGDIYEPWKEGELERVEVFESSIEDNFYLDKDDIEELKRKWINRPWVYAVRVHGDVSSISGRVYPMLRASYKKEDGTFFPVHLIKPFYIPGIHGPPREFDGQTEVPWRYYRAIDPGIRNACAILWVAVSPLNHCYVYREIVETDLSIRKQGEIVKAVETVWEKEHGPIMSIIDPAARQRDLEDGNARIDIYAKHGILCIPGNNSWEFGYDRMSEAFDYQVDMVNWEWIKEPKYRFFDTCHEAWRMHKRYVFPDIKFSAAKAPSDKPVKKDDHCCDALRYLEATGQGPFWTPPRIYLSDEPYTPDAETGY